MNFAWRIGLAGALIWALGAVETTWAQGRGKPPPVRQPPSDRGKGERPPPEVGNKGAKGEPPVLPERDKTEISIIPGDVGKEIVCPFDRSASYRIYAPRAFTEERRWPVIFVVAPGGGSATTFRRYTDGAELNGWLVAVSMQAGKTGKEGREFVDAMIRDVADRAPSDPDRFFLSGIADGAKLALACAAAPKGYRIAGTLISGAADKNLARSGPAALYALCGANSPFRREMVELFDPPGGPLWRMEFFPGGSDGGETEDVALGMAWLHAAVLRSEKADARAPRPGSARERFEKALMERIAQRKTTDIERAYDWAECLTLLNSPDFEKTGVLNPPAAAVALRNDPRVKTYREGRAEFLAFATQALEGGISGPDAVLRAKTLAFRYRDSRLRPLFEGIGQSVAK